MGEIGTNNGYDVKKSDSLGMAQRGGSVVSHVRWGKHVFSPMIKKGDVDFLIGFEQLEAARWAPYLKPGGVALVADVVVVPVSVIGSTIPYPSWDEIEGILGQHTDQTYLELEAEAWAELIRRRLPSKFVESSLEAFSRGANEANAMRLAKVARK